MLFLDRVTERFSCVYLVSGERVESFFSFVSVSWVCFVL